MAIVYSIRGTLVVFAIALLFAYMLDPLVDQIDKRTSSRSRTPALAITYLIVIGLICGVAGLIGTRVVVEIREIMKHPPDISGMLDRLAYSHPELEPLIYRAHDHLNEQVNAVMSNAPRLGLRVLLAAAGIVNVIIILILSFFILKDGSRIKNGFLAMFPQGDFRTELAQTLGEANRLLMLYVRALLTLCASVLIVFMAVLTIMRVPYALLLSTFAFFCEFVPLIGPLVAAIVIMTASAVNHYPHLLIVFFFLGLYRIVQDYIISPRVMGSGVRLHPMLVIFGVFAGGEIAGVAGIFLSVPLLALAKMALTRLSRHSK